MTEPAPPVAARFDPERWSDASARDALRLLTDSVTQMVGFEVAVLSLVQDDALVSVAISGPPSVHALLDGMRTPVDLIVSELDAAEDWGRFRFLSFDAPQAAAAYGWVPDIERGPEPDAWDPEDELLAPLFDESGELLGLLSIDIPVNGRRPDAQQRVLLERYAAQAERTLVFALEREALSQRLRLAEATRQVVRFAVSQPDIEQALDDCRFALLEGFRADDLSIRTYAGEGLPQGGSPTRNAPPDVHRAVHELARACWQRQRVGVLQGSSWNEDLLDEAGRDAIRHFVTQLGFRSSMLVPIGAASWTLGHLVLFRKDDSRPWTEEEQQSCFDVARDIGQAVLNARTLAREQRLVDELRRLSSYKSELLSTVSHELKNPLSAISGHLELMSGTADLDPDVQFSVAAMERASRRLVRLVGDLLTLAEVEDPDAADAFGTVDLRPLLRSTLELAQFSADRRSIRIEVDAPLRPLLVRGDEVGLDRVLANLVSNAVKYSPRGSRVCVRLVVEDGVVRIAVEDEGIGISTDDQGRLFTEFFRSTNPEALAEPGTGLGLAISARIVARHRGTLTVESELGEGSTFTVRLPTA